MKRLKRFVVFLLTAAMLIGSAAYGTSGLPTMFVNDEPWYFETQHPLVKIREAYYIPIKIFERLGDVTVTQNKQLENIMIRNGGDGKYISFDTGSSQFAYTEESGQFFLQTYIMNGDMRYVPAITVCAYFGFAFEMSANGLAMRITDGSETMSFDEVLESYNPAALTSSGEANKLPVKVGETPTDAGDRLYLMLSFTRENSGCLDGILEALSQSGASATFFMTAEDILYAHETVRGIMAAGSNIGIICENAAEAERANGILYKITKTKTRFCTMDGMTADGEAELRRSGMVFWQSNIKIDGKSKAELRASIAGQRTPVLGGECGEASLAAIAALLEIQKDSGEKAAAVSKLKAAANEINNLI